MIGCRFFLARDTGRNWPECIDGCHDSPAGVVKAAELIKRISGDEGPWLMVEVHPLPVSTPKEERR